EVLVVLACDGCDVDHRDLRPELERPHSSQVDPDAIAVLDNRAERIAAVGAAEDDARTAKDVHRADGLFGAAPHARPDRGCRLDGEHLRQETTDRIPVDHLCVHAHLPVAPNRSVLISRGSCPSPTRASATVSTNGVGPQTYTCGCSAALGPTSASIAASTRRA